MDPATPPFCGVPRSDSPGRPVQGNLCNPPSPSRQACAESPNRLALVDMCVDKIHFATGGRSQFSSGALPGVWFFPSNSPRLSDLSNRRAPRPCQAKMLSVLVSAMWSKIEALGQTAGFGLSICQGAILGFGATAAARSDPKAAGRHRCAASCNQRARKRVQSKDQ